MNTRIQNFSLIVFLLLLVFLLSLKAQSKDKTTNWPEPVFEHITIADGLPENSVQCIFQDHLGYMWFGTQNGLVRYDGYEMKVYKPDQDDSLSISYYRDIYSIYEDRSGNLWIGTGVGLNYFNRTTESFKRYLHKPDDSTSIISNDISSICEDKAGDLLVGTGKGLNLFNRNTEKFKHIYYQDSVYSESVYKYIQSLIDGGKTISSILRVGNNADLKKTFTINKKTVVLTVVMGEAGYDEGWLESSDGKLIIGKFNNKMQYARGNIRRYINSVIQVFIDTLNSGSYKLRYKSDSYWSYNQWGDTPPTYPEFWGIQVIELPESFESTAELLNSTEPSIVNYFPRTIMENKLTQNFYIGSNNRLFIFKGDEKYLTTDIRISGLQPKIGDINSFLESPDGSVWMGTSSGLVKINQSGNIVNRYQPLPSFGDKVENDLGKMIEDNNGFIWITGANMGLVCFDRETEQFKRFKHNPDIPSSISSNDVWSIYNDKSGIIWVGTGLAGINKWDRKKTKFKRFSFDPNNTVDGKFNSIYSTIEDSEGIIWFGNDNGLNSFNRLTNKFRIYKYNSADKDNSVTHIYLDESGIIWFGTGTRGLGKFNTINSSFQFYSYDPYNSKTIRNNNVSFILPDDKNVLWVGTLANGLNRFDKKTGMFTRYKYEPNNSKSLRQNEIMCTYKDGKGTLWIATDDGGLNRFYPADESFKPYDMEGDNLSIKDSYHFIQLTTIHEDQKGKFWIGTFQSGVYLFDRKKGISIYNITEKDGLANNDVRAILEDNSGNLWIGTGNGLSKFDPVTKNIKNYFSSNNFDENRYMRNSAFKTSKGEMLFGTYDGFILFHPDSVKDDLVPPQVVISNVSLFNEPEKKLKFDGFISELKELELSYNENDLRFDYVGLQFADPSKNRYKYRLEGFDKDWIDAGTQRNATYTNLDAGEYIFRVTACNADGVWNKEGASLKINIRPPFYATWWAYTIYVLLGLFLLYSLRRYELKRTLLKNQVKLDEVKLREREEADKIKSRFFANISHEFRTPLTLILGPSESIVSNSKEEETKKSANTIKRNADRLLGLINQLLDLSKLEAGKLELKTSKSNIVPFIKGITMSFESIAERKDITLKVKSSSDEIELYYDKEKMTKIMTNLLSNAFKFTPESGAITVALTLIPSPQGRGMSSGQGEAEVQIKVRDTGIGISEEELPKLFDRFYQVDSSQTREHEGTGIGLALTKELVELHHGTISADSKFGAWTEFTVTLPVGRKHLNDEEIIEKVTNEEVVLSDLPDRQAGVKNLTEFSITDSSSQVPQNDNDVSEDKYIVLVVEDNADVREFIKDSLGKEFQIEEASNGEQGVRKAEQIIPDLIISDVMMPIMDGNELTKRLKNDEKTSHIPIILLTAKSEQQSKLEGLEIGADDYLTKPFDTKELQIRINNLINIRRKLQEKFSKVDFVPLKEETERKLTNLEEKFMCKVMEVIENHISEEEFSIEQFGKEVGMSRVQLHRKLKALSGKSASHYLRSFRLSKAKQMIEEEKGNISEIAYSVGFSSPQYFTRSFKEEFGYPPSDLTT